MPPRRVIRRGAASAAVLRRKSQAEREKNDAVMEEERKKAMMVDINEPDAVEDDEMDNENNAAFGTKENDDKETVHGYGKDERLELDENEPEYCWVDYDDKESELEEIHELIDEGQEECGEYNLQEEEDDMPEEELENSEEEIEGEEDGEHELSDADENKEHCEVVKERLKRKEYEVFVGGLDKDATKDDLRSVFTQVGEIAEIRLMMNSHTGKNKGFAFLRFATVEQAKRAVMELKNPVINGKQCGVSPSQDSDTLFLGNICKTWTKEALKEKLKHYGVGNLEGLTLVEDNKGMNRGFAFLEFSSRSDAMDAFKLLQKRGVVFGVNRPAKISFADSFIDPGDEIMAQVKTVFVDGLAPSWDKDRVHKLLKSYGKVEKIELARNFPYAKRRDYGFVTFDSHDAAVACAKSINNKDLGEGDNKAKVRARLSRPGGKGRHVHRGDLQSSRRLARTVHGARDHSAVRSSSGHGMRGHGSRMRPSVVKRRVGLRDGRSIMSAPRGRPVSPASRSFERRPPPPPVSSYPKSSLKRDYGRRDQLSPTRSRAVSDYASRDVPRRRSSYRDDYYPSRYSDLHRSSSRTSPRRAYVDDEYARFERRPPSYHEAYAYDYDSVSGVKRHYSDLDDIPPRYADGSVRHPRACVEYDYGAPVAHYGDSYGDRLVRSEVGYGGSRSTLTNQNLHGSYGSRRDMGYEGSYAGGDIEGMYSSSYGGDYMSRGSDVVDGSSYSLYSGRGMGGSDYMGMGGSGSFYRD